jgi:hypothetical protein
LRLEGGVECFKSLLGKDKLKISRDENFVHLRMIRKVQNIKKISRNPWFKNFKNKVHSDIFEGYSIKFQGHLKS